MIHLTLKSEHGKSLQASSLKGNFVLSCQGSNPEELENYQQSPRSKVAAKRYDETILALEALLESGS